MIQIRIQHRPGRESIKRILEQVPLAVVVEDHGETHNPMRGYLLCLRNLPDEGHVCVLQDDVIVCRNFALALERIVAAKPRNVVSLFLSKTPKRTYNQASLNYGKSRYVSTHPADLVHVVGILWPVAKAQAFVDWVDHSPIHRGEAFSPSDDANVSRWKRNEHEEVLCTVPSIVQHPDDVPSIVNAHKQSRIGLDSGRTAGYWIGDDDPLDLDWSR